MKKHRPTRTILFLDQWNVNQFHEFRVLLFPSSHSVSFITEITSNRHSLLASRFASIEILIHGSPTAAGDSINALLLSSDFLYC